MREWPTKVANNHIAVVDLGYGDSGKGILIARLCGGDKPPSLVVKANGGSQCAHNVINDNGTHFTFSQFGAGTFSRVPTYLAKDFMFEPASLLREAQGLQDAGVRNPLELMHVAWNALMTTPYHWKLNQWQEDNRGEGRHGSTGRGIGMTAYYALQHPEDAPVAADLHDQSTLYAKLQLLREWVISEGLPEALAPSVLKTFQRYVQMSEIHVVGSTYFATEFRLGKVIFEGSQGVLLDELAGFHPHTTWSRTTDYNARRTIERFDEFTELTDRSMFPMSLTVIGVTRTYTTRHGAGPMVTEDESVNFQEPYNDHGRYQGGWRQGHLDLPALRYAIDACQKVDGIYVTHTDSVDSSAKWCERYELNGEPFELEHLSSMEAREQQTQSLYKTQPVLVDPPRHQVPQALAEALGRPLYGFGYGPRMEQGIFLNKTVWE